VNARTQSFICHPSVPFFLEQEGELHIFVLIERLKNENSLRLTLGEQRDCS